MRAEVFERYTVDDYRKWQGDWELIDGTPYAMAPSPISAHQILLVEFAKAMSQILEECKNCFVLVEEDYIINKENVVRPDLSVVCKDALAANIIKAPKLIVEIVSSSSAYRDEKVKFAMYERELVEYYILAYPEEFLVKMYRLENGNYKKVGDFCSETFEVDINGCKGIVDCKRVFKKLREFLNV